MSWSSGLSISDADIPALIARDAEVATEIATHTADTTAVHGITDTAQVAVKDAAQTFVKAQTVTPNTDVVPLTARCGGAGAANAQEWKATGGGVVAWVSASGGVTGENDVRANSGNAARTTIGARGPSSQAGISFGSSSDAVIYRDGNDSLSTGANDTFNAALLKVAGAAVTTGANDSGGAGFKVLRVPN